MTLAAPARHTEVILGSGFLAFARRADSPEEALSLLSELRALYPDATHHCWAYKIASAYRFSDDGEPGGTAGAPILRAIQAQGVDHVVVVVARYFGGTRLGVGGLARAYGGSAAQVLRLAEREEVRPRELVRVQVAFEHMSTLYRLLEDFDARRGEEAYDEHGLTLPLDVLAEDVPRLETALREATRGAAELTRD